MLAITKKPMTATEVFAFTGNDALCQIGEDLCRIMNTSENQEITVDKIVIQNGRKWGLREVKTEHPYKYFAMLIK